MTGALAVMGIWGAVRTVQVTIAWLLNSIGHAAIMGGIAALLLVPLIPGLFLAADRGGITAVAWVMLANLVASLAILSVVVQRRAHVSVRRQWSAIRPAAIACPVAWLSCWSVAQVTTDAPSALSLSATLASGAGAYLAAVSVTEPGLLRRSAAQIRGLLVRSPAPASEIP
jgi:hypothetical protein